MSEKLIIFKQLFKFKMKKILLTLMILQAYYACNSMTLNSSPSLHFNKNFDIKTNTLLTQTFDIVAKDLGLDTSNITINICDLLETDNVDMKSMGRTKDLGNNSYNIYMRTDIFKEDKIRILIHELVHVSQSVKGDLVMRTTFAWWKGTIIKSNVPYDKREYEIEAMDKTDELYNKYKNELK